MAKIIKIVTILDGSNVIGDVSYKDHSNSVVINKPLQIILQNTPNGASLQFAPYIPFAADGPKEINRDLIVTINDPIKEVLTQYTSATSTIIIPNSSITKDINV